MPTRKGDSIITFKPWRIIPLSLENEAISSKKLQDLPRYEPIRPVSDDVVLCRPVAQYIRKLLYQTSNVRNDIKYETIVSLHLVLRDEHGACIRKQQKSNVENDGDNSDDASSEFCRKSWKVVEKQIAYHSWNCLLAFVRKRLLVVTHEHPLCTYAKTVVPALHADEIAVLIKWFATAEGSWSKSSSLSQLALAKQIQDSVEPRINGVLLDDPETDQNRIGLIAHSCVPNGILEITRQTAGPTQLSIAALYGIHENDPSDNITVCLVEDDDSVESREAAVQRRLVRSCACLRCRYEVAGSRFLCDQLTCDDAIRLGSFYLSKGRLNDAKALYSRALSLDASQADVWHALGAIELSSRNFLQAQRIWKKAADEHPSSCQDHAGIALQLKKIERYGYLRPRDTRQWESPKCDAWRSVVPHVYVTSGLVDSSTCKKIIRWAEDSGQWTRQRHYAVPTHDVPVHDVEPLLGWFNDFMQGSVYPLLTKQFGPCPSCFYVHDAFCVRYEACQAWNHLPIHTDESTHSIVLALNDDYQGGGTYFYDSNETVHLRTGELLSFRGDQLFHGGVTVSQRKALHFGSLLVP